jgi:RNA polymerase sigma factor (sigma-70 family)
MDKYSKNGASPEKLKEHIAKRLNSKEISQIEFQEMYDFLSKSQKGRKTLESKTVLFKIYFKEKKMNAKLQELTELKENYDIYRNKIIESHIRYVINLAKSRMRNGTNLGDLISAGCNGLIYAIAGYNPKKSGFMTYAHNWIESSINRSSKDHLILHIGTKNEIAKYWGVVIRYKKEHEGKNPPLEKVAKEMRCSLEKTDRLAKAAEYSTLSLDMTIGDNKETLENFIPAEDKEIDGPIVNEEIQKFLGKVVKGREKKIVYLLFSHNRPREDEKNNRKSMKKRVRTLQEVGDILGISKERVRQIKAGIFNKLKREINKDKISKYYAKQW